MIYYKLRHNLIIPYQFSSNSGKIDNSHTIIYFCLVLFVAFLSLMLYIL